MTRARGADKPGYRTTEFWLSALVVVSATLLRLSHDIPAEAWKVVVTGATVGYGVSRGLAKK